MIIMTWYIRIAAMVKKKMIRCVMGFSWACVITFSVVVGRYMRLHIFYARDYHWCSLSQVGPPRVGRVLPPRNYRLEYLENLIFSDIIPSLCNDEKVMPFYVKFHSDLLHSNMPINGRFEWWCNCYLPECNYSQSVNSLPNYHAESNLASCSYC